MMKYVFIIGKLLKKMHSGKFYRLIYQSISLTDMVNFWAKGIIILCILAIYDYICSRVRGRRSPLFIV